MILAFNPADIIQVPFGWVLDLLYQLTSSYGLAMILFAVVVKLIMFPINAKSKKSSMKMSRLTPKMKVIQEKYADDPQKQNEAIRDLYKKEGVSMGGGCLWSLIPLFILIPLFTVIREPITYMLHEDPQISTVIVQTIKEADPDKFVSGFDQIEAAQYVQDYIPEIEASIEKQKEEEKLPEDAALSERVKNEKVDFNFLGIDLGMKPSFNVFSKDFWNWPTIGGFLIPVLSAVIQLLSMLITTKLNNSLITNEKGVQDKETAKNSQANQTNKTMMLVGPLMSLWIGFMYPAALGLYWLVQGLVSTLMDLFLTYHYRKIYDAEDAERLEIAMEEERLEAEKERIRAERRAANPDGITANTSKKKLQQKQQREAEAAKAAAAKEYAVKKGLAEEEAEPEKKVLSGIPSRPYCKGRAYDPDRYTKESTEE